jgi:HlyD family secretion protein
MERTASRRIATRMSDAWHRGVEWVRRHPIRALGTGVAAVLLVLAVRWLVPASVDTVTLSRQEVVETLVTTGRVQSVSRTGLGAPLVGTVVEVAVEEGDRVSSGQLLLALADAEQGAAVAEARARLAAAEGALRRVASVDLPSATASRNAMEQETSQRRRELERLRVLYEAGGLSRQELEVAQLAAEAAQARLEGARASAGSLAAGGADRRVAEAGVAQARQSLDAALARLGLTRVRAPAAGTVLIRAVEPGDAVQPGRVLMQIALDGPTELVVFPDERSVARLRAGQAAVASADAFPDQRFVASVQRIAPVVDPLQGTIEVRLAVPDPPAYLIPDMTVSVNVELDRRAGAWTLPLEVVRAPLTDTAWVLVVRDGRAERARVDVGIRDDRFIEIVSGVEEGEPVVAEPAGAVPPGTRVRARPRRKGGG